MAGSEISSGLAQDLDTPLYEGPKKPAHALLSEEAEPL